MANIRHFNKKFEKQLMLTDKDYIDIRMLKEEEGDYVFKHLASIPDFCRYCDITHLTKCKWEQSIEDIVEYM